MIRCAIIASTNGGVMKALLPLPWFRERIAAVLSDRHCGAVDTAAAAGIHHEVLPAENGRAFSEKLLSWMDGQDIDLFISFYTRLFSPGFVRAAEGRLINLHPSILPACAGRDGFGDTLKSGSRFVGSTAHFIDEGMDTGAPILQAARPYDPGLSLAENRHAVFVQQAKSLLQVISWFEQERIRQADDGKTTVINASYAVGEYAPNLDFDLALSFHKVFEEKRKT